MTPPELLLDHITVIAPDLASGVAHVADRLGIEVPFGGSHPLMGTHNALTRIGAGVFLEIVAIDPDAPPGRPRWFGLDEWEGGPQLAAYVLRTPDIAASLAGGLGQAGEAIAARRGELSWRISTRPDGRMAYDGALPSLIEWQGGVSPADGMPDLGLRLTEMVIEHPRADEVEALLSPRFCEDRLRFATGPAPRLGATFATPSGPRQLE